MDINPQPNYPYPFLQAHVLSLGLDFLRRFDFIWASCPCQRWVNGAKQRNTAHLYPDLITPVREMLEQTDAKWCMENVPLAPIRSDAILCGTMFDLPLFRHRSFELSGFSVVEPIHYSHPLEYTTVAGHPGNSPKGRNGTGQERKDAMGINWMADRELVEAVPPAYAEFIGRAAII